MPRLIALYIERCLSGFAISALFVAVLLYFDVANLHHLVTTTDGGQIAVFMLWIANGIIFAGVHFGISIMSMADKEAAPIIPEDARNSRIPTE